MRQRSINLRQQRHRQLQLASRRDAGSMAHNDDTKRKPKVNNANRQKRSSDAVIELRRHMRSCRLCHAAQRSMTPHDMCAHGIMLVLQTVVLLDEAIKLRLRASADRDGFFYPCPNPREHGEAWSQTVTPLTAYGTQDRLF